MHLKSGKLCSLLTLGLGVLVACPSQIASDNRAATQGFEAIPLVCPSILGQTWQNAKTWGSTAYDTVTGVATDANCNVFVTGWTDGAMNTIGTNPLRHDAFITKFSRSGTLLWTVQAGGDGEDHSNAITVDSSGNVLIAGYSTGNVNGIANQGGKDALMMKYDTNGSLVWTYMGGISGNDEFNGVVVGPSDNVIAVGETDGDFDGGGSQVAFGGDDILAVKLDLNGALLWTQQRGTSSTDYASAVALNSSGTIYITGETNGDLDGAGAQVHQGFGDGFLLKWNANGSSVWTRQTTLGTSASDKGKGIAVNANGEVFVVGDEFYQTWNGVTNLGFSDIFINKYSANGNLLWADLVGGFSSDYATGVTIDKSDALGQVYLSGYTYSSALEGQVNHGDIDAVLAKYSGAGAQRWVRLWGTGGAEIGRGVATDMLGNVYLAGDPDPDDAFVTKYNATGTEQ
jgi:Beta-propeller repeat